MVTPKQTATLCSVIVRRGDKDDKQNILNLQRKSYDVVKLKMTQKTRALHRLVTT